MKLQVCIVIGFKIGYLKLYKKMVVRIVYIGNKYFWVCYAAEAKKFNFEIFDLPKNAEELDSWSPVNLSGHQTKKCVRGRVCEVVIN